MSATSYYPLGVVRNSQFFKHAIELVKFETGKVVELHQVVGSKAYDLITACSIYQPISAEIIRRCLRA